MKLYELSDSEPDGLIYWLTPRMRGKKVLDINCASGLLDVYLAKQGHHITGVDPRSDLIETGQRELEQEGDQVKTQVQFISEAFSPDNFNPGNFTTVLINFRGDYLITLPDLIKSVYPVVHSQGAVIALIPLSIESHYRDDHFYSLIDLCVIFHRFFSITEIDYLNNKFIIRGDKRQNILDEVPQMRISLLRSIEKVFFEQAQGYLRKIEKYGLMIEQYTINNPREEVRKLQLDVNRNNQRVLQQTEKFQQSVAELANAVTAQLEKTRQGDTAAKVVDLLAMDVLRLQNEVEALRQKNERLKKEKTDLEQSYSARKPKVKKHHPNKKTRQGGIFRKAARYLRENGIKATVKRVLAEFRK